MDSSLRCNQAAGLQQYRKKATESVHKTLIFTLNYGSGKQYRRQGTDNRVAIIFYGFNGRFHRKSGQKSLLSQASLISWKVRVSFIKTGSDGLQEETCTEIPDST